MLIDANNLLQVDAIFGFGYLIISIFLIVMIPMKRRIVRVTGSDTSQVHNNVRRLILVMSYFPKLSWVSAGSLSMCAVAFDQEGGQSGLKMVL